MFGLLGLFSRAYSFISGSKMVWNFITNYRVLSDTSSAVSQIFKNMDAEGRKTPTQPELVILLQAFSNILKTNIIDIPGFDEIELTATVDRFSGGLSTSLKDVKSGKFHTLVVTKTKVKKLKPVEVKEEIKEENEGDK